MKILRLQSRHRLEELTELGLAGVELLEYRLAMEFHLVLWFARLEGRTEVVPEPKQARVEHLWHPADVHGTLLVQERGRLRGVLVPPLWSVTGALE